jgi:hypothetical protein
MKVYGIWWYSVYALLAMLSMWYKWHAPPCTGQAIVSNRRCNSCEYVGEVLAIPVMTNSIRKGSDWIQPEKKNAYNLAELEVLHHCKPLLRHSVVYSCDLQHQQPYFCPHPNERCC